MPSGVGLFARLINYSGLCTCIIWLLLSFVKFYVKLVDRKTKFWWLLWPRSARTLIEHWSCCSVVHRYTRCLRKKARHETTSARPIFKHLSLKRTGKLHCYTTLWYLKINNNRQTWQFASLLSGVHRFMSINVFIIYGNEQRRASEWRDVAALVEIYCKPSGDRILKLIRILAELEARI